MQKSFSQSGNLNQHLSTHSREKRHECTQCDKTFSRANVLRDHIFIHSGMKPYNCRQCNKSFSRDAHMRTHLLTHSGEKAHKCAECNKAFTRAETLRSHLIVHMLEWSSNMGHYKVRKNFQSSWYSEMPFAHSRLSETCVCDRQFNTIGLKIWGGVC